MTHTMEQKVEMINEYIDKLNNAIDKNDQDVAKRLGDEILGIYDAEIKGLQSQLSRYSLSFDTRTDYIGDAKLLQAKLRNYMLNLKAGLYRPFQDKGTVTVMQNAEQKVENFVQISLEQVVETINSLPEDTLSPDDKEKLNGKLASLSAQKGKDKATKWETAKSILKWIADKSVEVGIAALPYITEALK